MFGGIEFWVDTFLFFLRCLRDHYSLFSYLLASLFPSDTKLVGFPGGSVGKRIRLPVQEMLVRSLGWEDPPGGGHGDPLQYSCLESPMDRGAWWATVHSVAESDTPELTHVRPSKGEYYVCKFPAPRSAPALIALTNKLWWTTDPFSRSICSPSL